MRGPMRQSMLPGLEPLDESPEVVSEEPVASQGAVEPAAPVDTGPGIPDLSGQTVWVIDANSLIFQVFHAIAEMTSPKGEPVNATFGFTRDMLQLIEKKKPNYLFCAFDRSEPTFRHELFPEYKGHRSECPPDLIPQFGQIQRMLEALHIPVLSLAGYEADDILATLAAQTQAAGGMCYVVTSDKDCRQLITPQVKVYNIRKDQLLDDAAVLADWGVRPDQVVDFQALVGDPVDNVRGVPGIGPKGARELLEKYDTLENLLAHVDEISGAKKKQSLIDSRDVLKLSRQLVKLDANVPVEVDWNRGRVGGIDVTAALALCQELGFHRLGEQMRSLQVAAAPASWEATYTAVDTSEKFAALLDELRQVKCLSFDTETTSIAPTIAEPVGYALCARPGVAYYVPVRGPAGAALLDNPAVLAELKPILEDPQIEKIGQNLKYDMIVMRNQGVELRGVVFDSMVASYLLDAGERVHNLDELSARYLNHTTIKIDSLIGTGKQQKCMDEVPIDKIADYAAEDADVPMRLRPILDAKLCASELDTLFRDVEIPLIDVLAELEYNGIRVDVERLRALSEEYGRRMAVIEQEIYTLAGHAFNIASPKQMQQVLFEELKLPIISKTKTGASTDADVLEELSRQHPLPSKVLEYRQYAKLKGTYLDALPELVNPRTLRVHASFHQAVAATGRLSSSDPNLQNIPIRTEVGREIRSAFLPGADNELLLAADYSQIELRVLAHYSQDETLCAAFEHDEDIHALVASQVYNVPLGEVSKEQRRAAKAVNFGVVYGQSAFGLAKGLDIDQGEAQQFIDAYFARYPGVAKFIQEVLASCAQQGYVTTILGRRRAIQGIRPGATSQRTLAERTAVNTVIQGSAADIIKLAMINIHRSLKTSQLNARMLLQIHDELIFEVAEQDRAALESLVVEEMGQVMSLRVPLKVDVKCGRNWAQAE